MHDEDYQLDLQALHRVRERLVSQRTGIINQIRAFLLERGIAVRQRFRVPSCRASWPRALVLCYREWCASSKTWPATGPGSMSASRDCRARLRLSRVGRRLRAADECAGDRTIISSAGVAAIGTEAM